MRDLAPNMTDYLETRASFRLEVPDTYNYARDVVDAWAAREPDKLALLAVGPDGGQVRRFSFADLARASDRAARFLAAQGVRKGDRVFVMLPRIPDWYDVVLGCIKLGAVPMPATTLLTPRDIAYRVTQAEAAVAVVDAEGAGKVDEVAADCPSLRTKVRLGGAATDAGWLSWADGLAEAGDGPPEAEPTRADDPMLLYFTSGTVASQDGAAHAGVAGDRAPDHRAVLAGPRADRPALDAVGFRLGQGGLGQAVRPVGARRGQLPVGPARQARLRPAAAAHRCVPGHDVLRAADGVPRAGPDGLVELRLVEPAPLRVGG